MLPFYEAKPDRKRQLLSLHTATEIGALDASASTSKHWSWIQGPCLILGLHHLAKREIDAWLRDAQHLWDTVCPVLLSAAFHNQNIAGGKIAVPLDRVVIVAPQYKAPCGSERHRSCTSRCIYHIRGRDMDSQLPMDSVCGDRSLLGSTELVCCC